MTSKVNALLFLLVAFVAAFPCCSATDECNVGYWYPEYISEDLYFELAQMAIKENLKAGDYHEAVHKILDVRHQNADQGNYALKFNTIQSSCKKSEPYNRKKCSTTKNKRVSKG
ncbi:hypothetical protein V5799_026212 [Amblyomma americanum]|uniref:Secreted protein n=1 Tax=Amblyomma americanum TaxID=6943 RepID=A0AAQ4DJ81_AMBAM